MVVSRVDSIWGGTGVVGGGITQLFFNNGTTDAQAITDAVEDFWDAILLNCSNAVNVSLSPAVYTFNETDGELLSVEAVTPPATIVGDQTNHMLPTSTQGLIRWITAEVVNNRILRGRTFLPGMVEDNNFTPGIPGGGIVPNVAAACQALVDDATANLVIWHRPVSGSGGSMGQVIDGVLWDQWAVLRSRRD